MAAPVNGYCTLADLKSADVLSTPATATDDQFLCDIITAVSRNIDFETSRFFYQSSSTETHYFDVKDPYRLFVDDMVSVSAIATDDGSRTYPYLWTATDYDLMPYDAPNHSEPEPYRWIQVSPISNHYFPAYFAYNRGVYSSMYTSRGAITKGVKVTGVWGWPQVPALIAKACILWSARVFMRMAAPLGVTAMSALGQVSMKIPPPDPDIEIMIMNYSTPAV